MMPTSRSMPATSSFSSSSSPSFPPSSSSLPSLPTNLSFIPNDRKSHTSSPLIDGSAPSQPGVVFTTTPAASSSFSGGGASACDNIEMEPIAGHRRRKSNLYSPTSQAPPVIGRPRAQSLLNSHYHNPSVPGSSSLVDDTGKIPEEGSYTVNSSTPARDEQDSDSFSDEDLRDDEETGLTGKEKRRKQKRRRRNTLLDQRIARDKVWSADDQKEADKNMARRIGVNLILVLMWYLLSLSISLYNKWMFDKDRLNFAFPLFTTSMHMLIQFVLSTLVLYFVPSLRPQAPRNSDMGRSRHELEPPKSPLMSKMFYFTRIGPCGAATGLDIGLGNTSLKFISLTFYTMCKSSSLAFVLIFAFLFRLETPTWRLVTIIATMTVGVVLMVFGEVEFKVGGFFLVISAAFFSGFRWGLTQILLLRHPATSNPFSSIFYLTPVMFVTLLAIAIPVEGVGPLIKGFGALSDEFGSVMAPLFLLFPGCIAFLMTAAEFSLLQRTSVVTLSIAGIFKEVITITAASLVFDDQLTFINLIGLLVTMAAIIAYNYVKIMKMRRDAEAERNGRYQPPDSPISSSGSDSDDEDGDGNRETSGLLRQSVDMSDALVTSDGDIQTSLLPPTIRLPTARPPAIRTEEYQEPSLARND